MPKIEVSLSTKGLQKLQKEIEAYRKSLADKTDKFVKRLADAGISVAEQTILGGKYENYITFKKKVTKNEYGATALLIGIGKDKTEEWMDVHGGYTKVGVNGLIMEEFGSGRFADTYDNSDYRQDIGMETGRGTWKENPHHPSDSFPYNSMAQVYDEWWYIDMNGVRHETDGYRPSMPMLKAYIEMEEQIYTIAKEVFGGKK